MSKFYRYEPFEGFENERVDELQNHVLELKNKLKKANNEIEDIQFNCDHHYQFSSSGMYKDNFVCKHCGHETER